VKVINTEDEQILRQIINSNLPNEEKIEKGIYFFHRNYKKYKLLECMEAIVLFFKNVVFDLNPQLASLFFMDVFYLRAPEYSGTNEDKINYIEVPALTLKRLMDINFDVAKIIGGLIQVDHENHLGFQISQIFDYLFENQLINNERFFTIVKKIITNEYASNKRVGRLLGSLITFNIFKVKDISEIVKKIRSNLQIEMYILSDFIIGINSSVKSQANELNVIKDILSLDTIDLKLMKNEKYIKEQVEGLALVLSSYLYNNKSFLHVIELTMNLGIESILADAFKYMNDVLMIDLKRITLILHRFIYSKRLNFNLIPRFISSNFSKYEISKFTVNFFNKTEFLDSEIFTNFLLGFYNQEFHGFEMKDLKQLFIYIQKIKPNLLNSMNIRNQDEFLKQIDSIYHKKYHKIK